VSGTASHLFDLTHDELEELCQRIDLPAFTAGQVLDWAYQKGVTDPVAMTNLSKDARAKLAETLVFESADVAADQLATDDTRKLLLRWPAGGEAECVMIPTPKRRTACVSSQVGCPVGCRFCASGLGGLEKNLTAGQIVEQAYRLGRLESGRITNVVFMGMGEPLANFAAVTKAIRIMNASWGLGIGARRITVSTVGLATAIRRLATFDLPVTLALSLHAPKDDVRRALIPWDACEAYFEASGREITLEYILIRRVNDRPEHARELATVARRLRANVNLIRYNEVGGLPYDRPTTDDVHAFQQILRDRHVNVHIRASRGRDIAAACGQLRHENAQSRPQ
jgi:23S rRNA (adenine2503-C2)-methyltransferase